MSWWYENETVSDENKTTHKILVELDKKTDDCVRRLAEKAGVSMQNIASDILRRFFEEPDQEQK